MKRRLIHWLGAPFRWLGRLDYAAILLNLLLIAGVASLGVGIWLIYPPASLITLGVLAIAAVVSYFMRPAARRLRR